MPVVRSHSAARTRREPEFAIAPTDGELLVQYAKHGEIKALDHLLSRHGAMVWRVCRKVLPRQQDAEDAYQATFLILLRKASSIRADQSAAGWLYRVALRTALEAKHRRAARREETLTTEPPAAEQAFPDLQTRQHTAVLMEELQALPDKYRCPLVMRYLEGRSRRDIAAQTDTTIAAVQGQLARGKQLLRTRLARRGISLAVAMGLASQSGRADAAATPTIVTSSGTIAPATTIASQLVSHGIFSMMIATYVKPIAGLVAVSALAAMVIASDPDKPSANRVPSEPVLQLQAEPTATAPAPITMIAQAARAPAEEQAGLTVAEPPTDEVSKDQAIVEPQRSLDTGDILTVEGGQLTISPDTPSTLNVAVRPDPQTLADKRMELETTHWTLRVKALEKQVQVMAGKYRIMQQRKANNRVSTDQVLEAEAAMLIAEADAAEAKVKLAELEWRKAQAQPVLYYNPTPVQPTPPPAQPGGYYSAPQPQWPAQSHQPLPALQQPSAPVYAPAPPVDQGSRYRPARALTQPPRTPPTPAVAPPDTRQTTPQEHDNEHDDGHADDHPAEKATFWEPSSQPDPPPARQVRPASYPSVHPRELTFSPVRQVELSMGSMKFMLDLDTGQTMDPPAVGGRPEQARMDVCPVQFQPHDTPKWINFQNVSGAVMPPSAWEDNTPFSIGVQFSVSARKQLAKLKVQDDRWDGPSTCVFQTADGTQGLLQVMGTEQPEADGPVSVRLRYKTVVRKGQPTANAAAESDAYTASKTISPGDWLELVIQTSVVKERPDAEGNSKFVERTVELEQYINIQPNGRMLAPSLGIDLQVAGMTLGEAHQRLAAKNGAIVQVDWAELAAAELEKPRTTDGAPAYRYAVPTPSVANYHETSLMAKLRAQEATIAELQTQLAQFMGLGPRPSVTARPDLPALPPASVPRPAPPRAAANKLQPGEELYVEIVSFPGGNEFVERAKRPLTIDSSGNIALGAQWGRIKLGGKTIADAEQAVKRHINGVLTEIRAAIKESAEDSGHVDPPEDQDPYAMERARSRNLLKNPYRGILEVNTQIVRVRPTP